MLDKVKENWLAILVFSFFLFLGCKDTIYYMQSEKQSLEYEMDMYTSCQTGELPELACQNYQGEPVKRDVISTFAYISTSENIYPLQIYAPFFIMLVAGVIFHKQLRNGGFKNILTRISYKKAFTKIYVKTQELAFLLPLFLFLLFICCCFISRNFHYQPGISDGHYSIYGQYNGEHWVSFLPVYFLNFLLHGIFWINIVILNCKKEKNVFISLIRSYVEYYLFFIITDFTLGVLLLSNSPYRLYFGLTYIWTYGGGKLSRTGITCVSLLLAGISCLLVYLSYRNKEQVLEEIG